jgi:hypothetical protein
MNKTELKSVIKEVIDEEMSRDNPRYASQFKKTMDAHWAYQDAKMNKIVTPRMRAELDPLVKALSLIHKKINGIIKNNYNDRFAEYRNYVEIDSNGTVQIQVNAFDDKSKNPGPDISFKYPKA